MKFKIIYADPPWAYRDKLGTKMGGYDKYYKSLSLTEICNLPIKLITDKDCILFLWTTMPVIPDALKVIYSWGFEYKTTAFTWIKLNPKAGTIFKGVGRWVMGNAELVLLATKGKPRRITKNISQVVVAKRGKHSAKPSIVRDNIVKLMGDLPRIELFARVSRIELFAKANRKIENGWVMVGNEVDGQDIRVALNQIINNNYIQNE